MNRCQKARILCHGLLAIFYALCFDLQAAWDKAEGMKRHASSKDTQPMIIFGSVIAVLFLGVMVMWATSGKNNKKKK